jgi:DNA-directed RNA polymerase subunit RPC12/RpoP
VSQYTVYVCDGCGLKTRDQEEWDYEWLQTDARDLCADCAERAAAGAEGAGTDKEG